MKQIFLSYTHRDNLLPKEWVNQFREKLELGIGLYSNSTVKVFLDKKDITIGKHDLDLLENEVKASEIFLAILSGFYLNPDKSDWVIREKNWFKEKWQTAFRERFLFIEKRSVDNKEIEEELRSLRRFAFYLNIGDKNVPRPIIPDEREFENRIYELAFEISAFLSKQQAKPVQPAVAKTTGRIYVSAATQDWQAKRKILCDGIKAQGYEILGIDWNKDLNAEERKKEITEQYDKSDYIILFMNALPVILPDEKDLSLDELEYDVMKNYDWKVRKIKRLIKIPSQKEIDDTKNNLENELSILASKENEVAGLGDSDRIKNETKPEINYAMLTLEIAKRSPYMGDFFLGYNEEWAKRSSENVPLATILADFLSRYKAHLEQQKISISTQEKLITELKSDKAVDGLTDFSDKPLVDFIEHVKSELKS